MYIRRYVYIAIAADAVTNVGPVRNSQKPSS